MFNADQLFYKQSHKIEGFSLIELLVVLTIMGFMAVIIPPRFSGIMQSMQTKSSVREVVSALRQTRVAAINAQEEKVFTLDLENKVMKVANKPATSLPKKMNISLYTAKSEQISENVGAIRFFHDGSSTGGRIKLSLGKQNLYVDVNWLTGRVALLEDVNPEKWDSNQSEYSVVN